MAYIAYVAEAVSCCQAQTQVAPQTAVCLKLWHTTQESELVEARLERAQAEGRAQRAQQRLDDFLAQQSAPQVIAQLCNIFSLWSLLQMAMCQCCSPPPSSQLLKLLPQQHICSHR